MAFPIYTHQLTVTETEVTPRGPLDCGVSGDECATRLNFYFEAPDADSIYRLEVVCGDGTYDITDALPLGEDGPEVNFDIPASWTAAGIAAVRLVQCKVEGGEETARRHYPPFLLQFAYRDEGVQPIEAPLRWQELIVRAEAALDKASAAAAGAAEATAAAQRSLDQLQQSTENALKDIQDASNAAGGIVAGCADMRDAAQEFADAAANSARIAEEAAASAGAVGEHTHDASNVTYDGSEQYIGGSTVKEALDSASRTLLSLSCEIFNKSDVGHKHEALEVTWTGMLSSHGFGTVEDVLFYLRDQVEGFSTALDELHAYAQGLVNGGGAE